MKKPVIVEKPQNGSAFSELIERALKVAVEVRQMDSAVKLSPEAFSRKAHRIAYPGVAHEQAVEQSEALRALIARPQTHSGFEVAGVLRRLTAAYRSKNWGGPPFEIRRLTWAFSPTAIAELASLGSGMFQLSALAALIATRDHPEDFGAVEDLEEHQQRYIDLVIQRDELFKAIGESEIPQRELEYSEPSSDHRYQIWIANTGRQVALPPKENLGERLCNYLLTQQAKHES